MLSEPDCQIQPVGTVAEISSEMESNKKQRKNDAEAKAVESKAKKKAAEVQEIVDRNEQLPQLTQKLDPYLSQEKPKSYLDDFSKDKLRKFIRYYYQSRPVGLGTMKKAELLKHLKELMGGE